MLGLHYVSSPVIMLVRAMEGGGAQRDAIELANGLAVAGLPMAVATLDIRGKLRRHLHPDLPCIDLGGGEKLRMARAVPALRRLMQDQRPAAIIASEAAANCLLVHAASALPARQRPRIVLREVAVPSAARRADPYWQNRLAYRLAPWFYPRADLVVSLTAGVREELVRQCRVAPERAVNLGTNAVLSRARLAGLAASVPRRPDLIAAVGRLSPEKDFASLIAAFAVLRDERKLHLTILGEGPERPALERLVRVLDLEDSVSMPGFADDPAETLARAALFVSTSRHEGFGNAIVEALACGTPVVATDVPHGPREILSDGQCGRLVPPGNLHALIAGMRQALDTPPDRSALRRRAADFTTERAVSSFLSLLAGMDIAPAFTEKLP